MTGAVVFDFFGTLTDPAAEAGRRTAFDDTAAALGVPPDAFWAAMGASFPSRASGACGDTRSTLRAVAAACGVTVSAAALARAVAVHHEGAEPVRRSRPEALAVLAALRASGWRIGLISDCSSELVEAWSTTPYAPLIDAAVFSWRERRRKPDPRLYATVAERLGVPAPGCWYVGDGGSRELTGARTAGMRPVLVTNAAYPGVSHHRSDPDPFRPPDTVADLTLLSPLLGRPEDAAPHGQRVASEYGT
jgi:putative hydrolase of the HAD superfamily